MSGNAKSGRMETSCLVTDRTFQMVSDLASYANDLESIGFIRESEKLRQIAGDIENVSRRIIERAKK